MIEDRLSSARCSPAVVPGDETKHGIVELRGVGLGCAMAAARELDQRGVGDEARKLAAKIPSNS
jgi:hypothetical protein